MKLNKHYKEILPSEKKFGITIGMIFILISLIFINYNIAKIIIFIIGITLFLFGIIMPKKLIFLNKIWFFFGLYISKITNPIIMLFIFCILFIPVGLILRIFNINLLNKDKSQNSAWVKRDIQPTSMKNQF